MTRNVGSDGQLLIIYFLFDCCFLSFLPEGPGLAFLDHEHQHFVISSVEVLSFIRHSRPLGLGRGASKLLRSRGSNVIMLRIVTLAPHGHGVDAVRTTATC